MSMRVVIALALAVLGCNNRYHPDNFATGSVHGTAVAQLTQDCRTCHGADLTGGTAKVSCDGCHTGATPTAWRSNCTFCHGGTDNNTGAPPRDLDGTSLASTFPDHTMHVMESGVASAYDCVQCHVKASDVLSPGHIFGNPPGGAMNDFGAGLSPQGTFDRSTGTCSNLYCHGDGRGDNGTIAHGTAIACDGCHATQATGAAGWGKMSGPHSGHLASSTGITCGDCHAATTTNGTTIANKAVHVDGKVDVSIPTTGITWDATTHTCTGTCHNVSHNGLGWVATGGMYHPPGYSDPSAHGIDMELQRQDCRGCHGSTLAGGTTGAAFVGPSCDGCHSGATTTAWRSDCVFCHGGGNGDTRGMPPRDPGSTNTSVSQKFVSHSGHVTPTLMAANDCTTCHKMPTDVMSPGHAFNTFDNLPNVIFDSRNAAATYTPATGTCATMYCHGNGQGSNGTYTDGGAPVTCISCHGGNANSRQGLTGEHRNDHGSIACSSCHYATVSSGSTAVTDPTKHINLVKDVVFANGGTYDPSTKQCSNVGCHGTQTW